MHYSSKNILLIFCLPVLFTALLFAGCERLTIPVEENNTVPPAVPSGLSVYYASDGLVILRWNENKDVDILGYNIYRRINKTNFDFIEFTANNYFYDDSLSYTDTYYYRISAVNTSHNESFQTDSIAAQPINRYKPSQPRYLSINARNRQGNLSVYLRWQPAYEYDIKQYNVYRGNTEDFEVNSSSYIGSSGTFFFEDKLNLQTGHTYFYKVTAVDKGDLVSTPSEPVNDIVYPVPELISPADNSILDNLPVFKIKTLPYPAVYKIVVQSNEYSNEIWSSTIQSDIINDTLSIDFYYYGIEYGTTYYWRVLTYSPNGSEANSISNLSSFIIKRQYGFQ
jgi:hypothetical protein